MSSNIPSLPSLAGILSVGDVALGESAYRLEDVVGAAGAELWVKRKVVYKV